MSIVVLDTTQIVRKAWSLKALTPKHIIHEIADSISHRGLLNPLTVKPVGNKFELVDGVKRFKAIKSLKRNRTLPRTLHKIPCLVQRDLTGAIFAPVKPQLLSDSELARDMTAAFQSGLSVETLREVFFCSTKIVNQVLSLKNLNPRIKDCFDRNILSLDQAAAFATFPSMNAQWRLLERLGPFAESQEIIAAINLGATVVELPNGETLILPSRASVVPMRRKPYSQEAFAIAA